jgi:putative endonuclease
VDQNYRTRHGELDFVVRNDGTLVVLEVELRRGTGFGDPLEAVNLRKQRGVRWWAGWWADNSGSTSRRSRST